MKTSAAGRALIVAREGRRLSAYRDQKGILTIGVGHTGRMAGPPVAVGMTITSAECDALLATDLGPVEETIANAIRVPLSQNEFDAMASLGFNIGVGGLARSSVVRRINAGDAQGAADAFLAWSKPASLAGRRRAERAQFLTPDEARGDDPTPSKTLHIERSKAVAEVRARSAKRAQTAAPAIIAVTAGAGVASTAGGHHFLLPIVIFGGVVAAMVAAVGWWLASRAEALKRANSN